MSEKKYYCFCGSNCKYETMTKEQIMAAIAQATGVTDIDPDAGFISKVKETNGRYVTFWVGTQAQYNALQVKEENCLYIITDDTSKADFEKTVADMQVACDDALAAAAAVKSVDISSEMVFTIEGFAGSYISYRKFVYAPALGIVFYGMMFAWETAALNAGDQIVLTSSNRKYMVAGIGESKNNGQFTINTMSDTILLTANEDITEQGYTKITGWYFCNGE